ncbi:MAG: hypothetical protein ACI4UM_05555 [Succinivibrio sp.]
MNRKIVISALALSLLCSCSSYRGNDSMIASKSAVFALIPFANHSNTPMASENVQAIVSSELKAKDINTLCYSAQTEAEDLKSLLDDEFDRKQAVKWLDGVEYSYVITGSVDEWNYKAGLDGEPVVGITIEIRDKAGRTVYQKTGTRSGFGRESLNYAGQKVVSNILDDIKLN